MRERAIRTAALTLVAAATLALPAAAAARHHRHRGCAALGGRNRVHSTRIKIVIRNNAGVAYACAKPHGRVFEAESFPVDIVDSGSIAARQFAGDWVLFTVQSANQYENSLTDDVYDARTGARYTYWASIDYHDGAPPADPFAPVRVVLDRRGRLAGLFSDGTTIQVEGFGPSGKMRLLDSAPASAIPAQSFSFSGGTVVWTDAGQARTATL